VSGCANQSKEWFARPLLSFSPPPEAAGVERHLPSRRNGLDGAPFHEVSCPSAFPRTGQRHRWSSFHTRPPAPSGSHNLLALRSAPSLLALFHARSALGLLPPEPFSSQAAVRCLQRRSPPGVQAVAARSLTAYPTRVSRRTHSNAVYRLRAPSADPHLQGLAPPESSPLPTGGLDRPERVALLGLLPLQGSHPSPRWRGFHLRLPSCGCPNRRERPPGLHFRVLLPMRLAGLSRDCRPSWGLSPSDLHDCSDAHSVRESPPRGLRCVTALSPTSL